MADDTDRPVTHDTQPEGWTLHRMGNLLLDVQQEMRAFRRAVIERIDDLQLRVTALERGQRLVPLNDPDGDNGLGG